MKNAPWALASGEKTDFPAGTLHSAFSRRFIFRGSALRCSVEPQLKRPKRWLKRLTPTLAFDLAPHRKDSELRPERRLRRNMFSKPPIVRVNGANVWGQWSPLCGKDPGSGTPSPEGRRKDLLTVFEAYQFSPKTSDSSRKAVVSQRLIEMFRIFKSRPMYFSLCH